MKENRFIKVVLIIMGVLLSLNLIVLLLSNPVTSYAAKNIQYKVLYSRDIPIDECVSSSFSLVNCFEKIFNEYGKEDWEYIDNVQQGAYFIFKR